MVSLAALALLAGMFIGWVMRSAVRRERPPLPIEPRPAAPASYSIADAVADPLLLVENQRVLHANAAAKRLLGDHIEQEDVRMALRQPGAADILSGRTTEPVLLPDLGGRGRRWELSVRDVADRTRLLQLRDRSEQLAAERMRVDFVANASHELRTPLATLIGFIETLEDANTAEDAPTRARFLRIMGGEAKRMQALIDDLMSLSRIEADRYSAPETPVDFGRLLALVCADVRSGHAEGVRLVSAVQDGAPLTRGDQGQLSQMLHNIIGNALKYSRPGTPVEVALTHADGLLSVTVRDQGDGIAPEHLPRLTERFYRADPGRSRAVGGTGLGLAIVKHIVERHRGELSIASEPGEGTTVTVRLRGVTER